MTRVDEFRKKTIGILEQVNEAGSAQSATLLLATLQATVTMEIAAQLMELNDTLDAIRRKR